MKNRIPAWIPIPVGLLILGLLRGLLTGSGVAWHGIHPYMVDVVGMASCYVVLVITIRWQMIAGPIRNQIWARVEAIRADVEGGQIDVDPKVRALLSQCDAPQRPPSIAEVLFWSRGRETASWQLIDEVEERLVASWPPERIAARLPVMRAELAALDTGPAKALISAIDHALYERDGAELQRDGGKMERELYIQGMILQRRALRNNDLQIDYHNNKLLWYIVVSLAAIVMVATLLPPLISEWGDPKPTLIVLIGGLVGGVLSRLTRAVRTDHTEHELGLRWMALFLSPLLGALAGWAGIQLLAALEDGGVLTLGAWAKKGQIGLAVVLGLSERLFTDLVSRVDGKARGSGTSSTH